MVKTNQGSSNPYGFYKHYFLHHFRLLLKLTRQLRKLTCMVALQPIFLNTQKKNMKKTIRKILLLLITASMLSSCSNSNQSNALSDAKELQSAIQKMQPGGIPTTEAGWTMTAKINGKEWVANSILSPKATGRIVGDNNGVSISLPYDRRSMVVGDITTISHNNAVDLMTNDDVRLWGGYKGAMKITKVDNEWAEGKFYVSASDDGSGKTLEVTNGFFRISIAEK